MSRRWATVVACRPSSSSWRTVSRRFAWTGRIAVAGSGRWSGNAWAFEVVSTAAVAGLWLWALVYLGLVGVWALRGFARRDL